MDDYEVVFDAVAEDFTTDMFGHYANSVSRKDFKRQLMSDGWKYFDLNNLNELFSIKYDSKVQDGEIEPEKLRHDSVADGQDNLSLNLAQEELILMKDQSIDGTRLSARTPGQSGLDQQRNKTNSQIMNTGERERVLRVVRNRTGQNVDPAN